MEQKKSKKWLAAVLILLLLLGTAAGVFYFLQGESKDRLARDEDALGGILPGKTDQEIQELLNQKVQEGMVNIGIAAEPVFEEGGKKGKLGIENVPGNNYSFQVDMILDETGEKIYSSGLIEPGFYVEYVALNKQLAQGDYKATAIFTTYSLDETTDEIAKTNVNITLRVKNDKYYK